MFNVVIVLVRLVCVWVIVCKDDADVTKVGIDVHCVVVWRGGIAEVDDGTEIDGAYVSKDDVDLVGGGVDVLVNEFDSSVSSDNGTVVMFALRGRTVNGTVVDDLFPAADTLASMFNSGS